MLVGSATCESEPSTHLSYDAASLRAAVARVRLSVTQARAGSDDSSATTLSTITRGTLAAMATRMATRRGMADKSMRVLLGANRADVARASDSFDQEQVDIGAMPPRALGDAYEAALGQQFTANGGRVASRRDKQRRRATGSFFTPQPLVTLIVERTLGPVVDAHVAKVTQLASATQRDDEAVADALFDIRVLDPAMGGGFFLLEAIDNLARRIKQAAAKLGVALTGDVRARIASRCVFGFDIDPLACAVARAAVMLHVGRGADDACTTAVAQHLVEGNALAAHAFDDRLMFDAVIGNPPHSGHRSDAVLKPLAKRFAVCRTHANAAAAFCELAFDRVRPRGRVGLVLPKACQYVAGWRPVRDLLVREHELELLVDASKAFRDVKLEQSIIVARKADKTQPSHKAAKGDSAYKAAELEACTSSSDTPLRTTRLPLSIFDRLGVLPAAIGSQSAALFEKLLAQADGAQPTLGDLGRTSQALGYQSKLNHDAGGKRVPIHRGKQVRPMRLAPATDWIDERYLMRRSGDAWTDKAARMTVPKVVTQNIVAHVTRPRPRLWIISAPDPDGVLCLNTVSVTLLASDRVTPAYVAALLNSSVASWFFSELVFCRAVRTMHFDHAYASKLPVPPMSDALRDRAAALCVRAQQGVDRHALQRAIDDVAFDAYALSDAERNYVRSA